MKRISATRLAALFSEYAERVRHAGGSEYRVRAYRDVVKALGGRKGGLSEDEFKGIRGVGEGIGEKFVEIAKRGTFEKLERLRKVQGPVIEKSAVSKVDKKRRFPRETIGRIGGMVVSSVRRRFKGVGATVCGSFRRGLEKCGDVDVLVSANGNSAEVAEHFRKVIAGLGGYIKDEAKKGTVKVAAQVEGIDVDLRIVPPASEGAGLLYFTGSKNFNIRCRSAAIRQGLKLNEYGLWKGKARVAHGERSILEKLGIGWVPPEGRSE